MPIHRGKDTRGKDTLGSYYQYGLTGKKYYYVTGDKKSRLESIEKSKKQRSAIKTNQKKVYDFPN